MGTQQIPRELTDKDRIRMLAMIVSMCVTRYGKITFDDADFCNMYDPAKRLDVVRDSTATNGEKWTIDLIEQHANPKGELLVG